MEQIMEEHEEKDKSIEVLSKAFTGIYSLEDLHSEET